MDRRDQELLDKQMRHVLPAARNDSVIMLALAAMFFAGMAIGGFFYAYTGAPVRAVAQSAGVNQQVASNEVPIFVPQVTTARP
jgi:hypothetical protein